MRAKAARIPRAMQHEMSPDPIPHYTTWAKCVDRRTDRHRAVDKVWCDKWGETL